MRTIVFDLYNTLLDVKTDERKESTWQPPVDFLAARGIRVDARTLRDAFERCGEEWLRESARSPFAYPEIDCVTQMCRAAKSLGGTLSRADGATAVCLMRQHSVLRLRPFAGTTQLLEALKAGGARLYLLSNAQAAFTHGELTNAGLRDYFDGILLSSECGCRKPDPAFFGLLFDKFRLEKSDAVMVGDDATSDGDGAAAFGIPFFHTPNGAAARSTELLALLKN